MKIGFIARADNSGLGTMSWEFAEHLRPDKILIIENGAYRSFPERYKDFNSRICRRSEIKDQDLRWLIEDIDMLVAIETPYKAILFDLAQRKGIKRVLIPMYEQLPHNHQAPDLYLCVSPLDYQEMLEPKTYIPWPVNRERIPYRRRTKAHTFIHNAGHGGMFSRNGTNELLEAIPLVKSDVKFIINSQFEISCPDPRVEIRVGNKKNYWDLWTEGDVFVFPEKFNALSLPINESLAAGIPVMSTDRFPFNTLIPKEILIPIECEVWVGLERQVKMALVTPQAIAANIDKWANQDISHLSDASNQIAEEISWEKLLPKYKEVMCVS